MGLIETSPANTCYSSVDFDDSSVDFNDSSGVKVSAGTAKTQIQYLSALNLLLYFDIYCANLLIVVTIKNVI